MKTWVLLLKTLNFGNGNAKVAVGKGDIDPIGQGELLIGLLS